MNQNNSDNKDNINNHVTGGSKTPLKISAKDELKPIASWQTSITKIVSGLGIAFSAAVTIWGVAGFMKGSSLDDATFGKTIIKIGGLSTAALGSFGLGTNCLVYSSADAASRARNFSELQERLDEHYAARSK